MIIDDEKLDKAIDNYVTSMTREQLEDYVSQERIDYFYGGGVDQEEIDYFIDEVSWWVNRKRNDHTSLESES